MSIIAPLCKYKRMNYKIYMVMLLAFAVYFAYDGYFNQKFIDKHTKDGRPDSTLAFNRKSPPFFLAGVIAVAVYFWMVKDKKVVAGDEELVFSEKDKIPYSSIESINKSNFETNGFFVIEYKLPNGQKSQRKVSDRTYDNLNAVLEVIVSKITG